MQDEINEKTVALYIKTGKLTAEVLQKAIKKLLSQAKKELDRQAIPHGKQTLKQLMKQNAGAFKEFSAKKLTQDKKPSIRKALAAFREKAKELNASRQQTKHKDREVSL